MTIVSWIWKSINYCSQCTNFHIQLWSNNAAPIKYKFFLINQVFCKFNKSNDITAMFIEWWLNGLIRISHNQQLMGHEKLSFNPQNLLLYIFCIDIRLPLYLLLLLPFHDNDSHSFVWKLKRFPFFLYFIEKRKKKQAVFNESKKNLFWRNIPTWLMSALPFSSCKLSIFDGQS